MMMSTLTRDVGPQLLIVPTWLFLFTFLPRNSFIIGAKLLYCLGLGSWGLSIVLNHWNIKPFNLKTPILHHPPHLMEEFPWQLCLHSCMETILSSGGATFPHQHSLPFWTPAKENSPFSWQASMHLSGVREGTFNGVGRSLCPESFTHSPAQDTEKVWCLI